MCALKSSGRNGAITAEAGGVLTVLGDGIDSIETVIGTEKFY